MNGNPSARQLSALANVCIWTLGFFGAQNTAGWVKLERGQILRALRGVLTSHGQNLTENEWYHPTGIRWHLSLSPHCHPCSDRAEWMSDC